VTQDENPYGFIGRDSALLALERALRRPPAGILIHGLGGIGKTTLAKGFLRWLAETGGLMHPPFWFTFNDIRSSEHAINQMIARLFGTDAMAAGSEQKIAALVQAFKEHPFVIVWDNFESASGIEGTEVQALLPEEDRQQLRELLY
jgi:SpoVK/Ycf46/Vps4 family AAA+-type ATPase